MLKPRIKTPHRPHLRPDGTVWIGSLHYGLATELQDESGLVWSLCRLLDGTRPPSEITAEVAVEHRTAQREVDEVLGFLVASVETPARSSPRGCRAGRRSATAAAPSSCPGSTRHRGRVRWSSRHVSRPVW
ncbi:hypothetical protein STANM309S_03176 [Streptomyces tanashiensis]